MVMLYVVINGTIRYFIKNGTFQ